ncbi:MAG TPA: LytTR family DNA-binding domain-containing protein [Caulobacteraceae bacterium]
MTSGDPAVTSGGRAAFWTAWAIVAAFVLSVDLVNALSIGRDRAAMASPLDWWAPYLWEFSSGAASLLVFPLIWRLFRVAPPRPGGWGRFAAVHLPGSMAFSLLHVGGFMAIRAAAYAGLGLAYRYGSLGDFIYEYRKDVLGYAIALGVIWAVGRARAAAAPPATAGAAPATFDIRDGARLLRTPVGDILAVSSAGNYAEFHLVDGRKPLMRITLAEAETRLSPLGLVRTHRSWLINAARVRMIEPEGSGDRRIRLEGGLEAPLSRRFSAALERLRAS